MNESMETNIDWFFNLDAYIKVCLFTLSIRIYLYINLFCLRGERKRTRSLVLLFYNFHEVSEPSFVLSMNRKSVYAMDN